MQRVTLVRYATKPETTAENEALSQAVFEELRSEAPKNVAYLVMRNGDEFVHLFINTSEADSAPVTELPSFKAYSKDIGARFTAPPEITRLDFQLVNSYGLK